MPREVQLAAHGKVNLLLRVLAREASGYHGIETLLHRIELADDVTIRVGGSGRSIDCRGADVGPADRNLAFRAAVAYADATAWPTGFSIEIDKHIPAGGGLGGGSADAGAVLRGLDSLAPAPLGERLANIGAALGADVPFLTQRAPFALGWNRGERLLTLSPPPPRFVAIVFPEFGVATADAYRWLSEDRTDAPVSASVIDQEGLSDWRSLSSFAHNDFDAVVGHRHPVIAAYVATLRSAGADVALLAGSGSSVFGVFESRTAAAAALQATGARGIVTQTLTMPC